LDVDTNHPDHPKADAWLQGKHVVTCPLAELGFLRISTNPKALNSDMRTAKTLLEAFVQKHNAEFIPDEVPALKCSPPKSDQVTDTYLASLAASKQLKLATLDTGIVHSAVELIS
jgi:predicted nucleic acid-binding protein